jgi:hypothetical protein
MGSHFEEDLKMRRLSGVLLAGAILLLPAFSQTALAQGQKTTYTGEVVIAAYIVNAGKEADYEKVMATLKDALAKSSRPEAKQQLAGWKVIKNAMNQPDGSPLYVHIITPVKDADYSIGNIVYEVVKDPAEQTAFFNLYKGALQKPLFLIQGAVTSDFSK